MEQLPWKDVVKISGAYRFPLCKTFFLKPGKSLVGQVVAASKKAGFPVFIKAYARDIPHKGRAGLVKEAASPDEVPHLVDAIIRNVGAGRSKKFEGIAIQPKVAGYEFIAGMQRDAVFGPVVLFGLGGQFVEAFSDFSLRIAPVSRADVVKMVEETAAFRVIQQKKLSLDAVVSVILKLSAFSVKDRKVSEIDFNPLILDKEKATIVDPRFLA